MQTRFVLGCHADTSNLARYPSNWMVAGGNAHTGLHAAGRAAPANAWWLEAFWISFALTARRTAPANAWWLGALELIATNAAGRTAPADTRWLGVLMI